VDHSQLNAWAAAHTALLVEGQTHLRDLVGADAPEWELNLTTGVLILNGVRLQFALLGSVDEEHNTWLWSWADPGLDQRAIAIERARPLQAFGQQSGLWEYTEASFPMEGVVDMGMTPGATLSLVARPQILGGAIFSGPYPGGRLYTVVTDPRLGLQTPSAFTAPRYITGALAYGLGNPRDIVTVYAGAHGLEQEEADQQITIKFEDHTSLEVVFDDQGRLRHMHGVVPPPRAELAGTVSAWVSDLPGDEVEIVGHELVELDPEVVEDTAGRDELARNP
jgi:hypothetical protein